MSPTHHNKLWRRHPAVRTGDRLTFGERAADVLRSSMGSWPFVFGFLSFMGAWALLNSDHGFDPYPYILLNLFLSMLAGLQGAILLISAKRQDTINAALAQHDREVAGQILARLNQLAGLSAEKEEAL